METFKQKIAIALTTVSVAGSLLTACGANNSTSSSSTNTETSNGPVTVQFWHSSSGAAGDEMNKLIEKFNKEHEGKIKVVGSFQGSYEDSIAKFTASVQTGNLPTLLQASDVQTTYLKDSHLMKPAAELAKADSSFNFDSLNKGVSNYYTMDNTVYSMPAMVSLPTLYVNEDILSQAGVKVEDLKTTKGLLDAANLIHEKTGKAGLTFHQSGWYMEESASSLGIDWCTPDNGVKGQPAGEFNFDNSALKNYWGQIGKLYSSGALANPGKDGNAAIGSFTAGEVGILMNSSGAMGNIMKSNPSFNWTSVALPRDNAEAGSVPGGNSLWAVQEGHNENDLKAAWEFMKFIGSEESQKSIFETTGYLPTVSSAIGKIENLKPQQQALLSQLQSNPVNTHTAGCHSGALNNARSAYQTAMSQLANGTDINKAFDDAKAKTAESIANYNKRAKK